MENILDIIYSYSKKSILLDEDAIKKIIDILIEINNLDSIEEVNIINKYFLFNKNQTLGSFGYDSISINLINIYKDIKNKSYKTKFYIEDNLSEYEKDFNKNLYIFNVLAHEIEHAVQLRDAMSDNDDLENSLVALTYGYIFTICDILKNENLTARTRKNVYERGKQLYNENYDISIIERLANIDALSKVIEIISYDKKDLECLYKLYKLSLLQTKMTNYKNVADNPTRDFFYNLYLKNQFDELMNNNRKLDTETKLRLGLKLEPIEVINNFNELSPQLKR